MLITTNLKNLQRLQQSSKCVVVTFSLQQRPYSSEPGNGRSVADRFSWLLAESHNSGVVDGLKKTYRSTLSSY